MDVFPISPASPRPLWILVCVCVLLLIILGALSYTAWSSRNSRVELGSDGIRLAGDFWARRIPYRDLDVTAARVLDLTQSPRYTPARRTLGTGLPGYASGWFRLRSGEKALVYLTRRDRVVYVPTSLGYSLLLSIAEPRRFVERLGQLGS